MAFDDRELIQAELLKATYLAKKRLEWLESALAHNRALMGAGIELPDHQLGTPAPELPTIRSVLEQLEIEAGEDDLSNYLGIEGDDSTRPKLANMPEDLRPTMPSGIDFSISELAAVHPAEDIDLPLSGLLGDEESPGIPQTQDFPASGLGEDYIPTTESIDDAVTAPPDALLRYYLALKTINDGVWDWNTQTNTVWMSERWKEVLGVEANNKSTPLQSIADCLHPEDAEKALKAFKELLAGDSARASLMVRTKRKNKVRPWALLRAICMWEEGTPVRVLATAADITELREAKMILKSEEEHFKVLAEGTVDLVFRFDQDRKFAYVSPNISRYLKATSGDLLGKTIEESGLGGDIEFYRENLEQAFELGLPIQTEVKLSSPLFGLFISESQFWPELDANGKVLAVTAQLRDMTMSHQVSEKYRALFNSMGDGLALFEYISADKHSGKEPAPEDFTLISMNRAVESMFRKPSAAALGRNLSTLLGKDAPKWVNWLSQVLDNAKPEARILPFSEFSKLFEVSSYSTEPGRIACVIHDVTKLKTMERELRLNDLHFNALRRLSEMEDEPDDDIIRFALNKILEITGSALGFIYCEHGLAGKLPKIYWADGGSGIDTSGLGINSYVMSLRDPMLSNDSSSIIPCISGHPQQIARHMIIPVTDDDKLVCVAGVGNKKSKYNSSDLRQMNMFLGSFWQFLRRRWAVRAMIKARDEAEAASRAKNIFLANVSHELRTPLNGILGMLQLLQMSSPTSEQSELINTANNSGQTLLRVLSDILDFSRMEANRFDLSPQLFDISSVVLSTVEMFRPQTKEKGLNLSVTVSPDIPKMLIGDDARLRQILLNLVGNAVKFTEKGSITVECDLLPHRPNGQYTILFTIKDTGIGIPESRFDDIFQAFTQIDGSRTRRYPGTGLGLVIVKRLVDLMGGSLTVESAEGQGTSFYCSLQFKVPVGMPGRVEAAAQIPDSLPPMRCLVAEDDQVSRLTVKNLLKKKGVDSVCVTNGRMALEALSIQNFDCLITDIQMPEMDGLELVKRIREENIADITVSAFTKTVLGITGETPPQHSISRNLPVVALTAHAMQGDKEQFLAAGMDYYLGKPIIAKELYSTLQKVAEDIGKAKA